MIVGDIRYQVSVEFRELINAARSIENALKDIGAATDKTNKEMTKLSSSAATLGKVLQAVTTSAAAAAIGSFTKQTMMAAARADVMATALSVVGENAFYTQSQLQATEQAMRRLGISVIEAREAMTRWIQMGMELTEVTKLARAAQDLAAGTTLGSSEAFDILTLAIAQQLPRLLRQFGIVKGLTEIYSSYAAQIGKTAAELTSMDKRIAMLNVIYEEAAKRSGAYVRSMQDSAKVMSSITTRVIPDLKAAIGEAFLPILDATVLRLYDWLKALSSLDPAIRTLIAAAAGGISVFFSLAAAITAAQAAALLFGATIAPYAPLLLAVAAALGATAGATVYLTRKTEEDTEELAKNFAERQNHLVLIGQLREAIAKYGEQSKEAAAAAQTLDRAIGGVAAAFDEQGKIIAVDLEYLSWYEEQTMRAGLAIEKQLKQKLAEAEEKIRSLKSSMEDVVLRMEYQRRMIGRFGWGEERLTELSEKFKKLQKDLKIAREEASKIRRTLDQITGADILAAIKKMKDELAGLGLNLKEGTVQIKDAAGNITTFGEMGRKAISEIEAGYASLSPYVKAYNEAVREHGERSAEALRAARAYHAALKRFLTTARSTIDAEVRSAEQRKKWQRDLEVAKKEAAVSEAKYHSEVEALLLKRQSLELQIREMEKEGLKGAAKKVQLETKLKELSYDLIRARQAEREAAQEHEFTLARIVALRRGESSELLELNQLLARKARLERDLEELKKAGLDATAKQAELDSTNLEIAQKRVSIREQEFKAVVNTLDVFLELQRETGRFLTTETLLASTAAALSAVIERYNTLMTSLGRKTAETTTSLGDYEQALNTLESLMQGVASALESTIHGTEEEKAKASELHEVYTSLAAIHTRLLRLIEERGEKQSKLALFHGEIARAVREEVEAHMTLFEAAHRGVEQEIIDQERLITAYRARQGAAKEAAQRQTEIIQASIEQQVLTLEQAEEAGRSMSGYWNALTTSIAGGVATASQTGAEALLRFGTLGGAVFNTLTTSVSNMVIEMTQTFANGVARMIVYGESFGKSFGDVIRQMVASFISAVIQMMMQWLAFKALTAMGVPIPKAAGGGQVGGAAKAQEGGAVKGSKAVPILAHEGEWVIKTSSVRKYGESFMAALNQGLLPVEPLKALATLTRRPIITPLRPRLSYQEGGVVSSLAAALSKAGAEEGKPINLTINNVVDPKLMEGFIASPVGERVILNVIARNRYRIREVL